MLKGICDKLDVNLIASNFDKKTGALIGNNCYGDEKVRRLKEIGIERCDKSRPSSTNIRKPML